MTERKARVSAGLRFSRLWKLLEWSQFCKAAFLGPVLCRERADGLVTPLCYLAAKLVEELCISCLTNLALGALLYYVVDYSGSFLLYFCVTFTTSALGINLGWGPLPSKCPLRAQPIWTCVWLILEKFRIFSYPCCWKQFPRTSQSIHLTNWGYGMTSWE